MPTCAERDKEEEEKKKKAQPPPRSPTPAQVSQKHAAEAVSPDKPNSDPNPNPPLHMEDVMKGAPSPAAPPIRGSTQQSTCHLIRGVSTMPCWVDGFAIGVVRMLIGFA